MRSVQLHVGTDRGIGPILSTHTTNAGDRQSSESGNVSMGMTQGDNLIDKFFGCFHSSMIVAVWQRRKIEISKYFVTDDQISVDEGQLV